VNNAVAAAKSDPILALHVQHDFRDITLNLSRFDEGEDSDDWLIVDSGVLDDVLTKSTAPRGFRSDTQSQSVEEVEYHALKGEATKLQEFAGKVQGFVESEGDLEGARFNECVASTSGPCTLNSFPVRIHQ
jgi:hypothetical protein